MLANESSLFKCPQYAVENKNVRIASFIASRTMEAFDVEMSMRCDVYNNVVAFKNSCELKNLSPEIQRFVEKTIIDGKRNGKLKSRALKSKKEKNCINSPRPLQVK